MTETGKWVLSGFADEIDQGLDLQIRTLNELDVPGLDLRSVNGMNVLDLAVHELFQLHDQCAAANIHVQSIGSPINKIPYDPLSQATELERLGKAIKAARHLNVKRIRLFTPEVSPQHMDEHGPRVISWMREQKSKAEENGLILIVENDARYWSAYPENARRMFDELGGPSFRAAFDFANTVLIGFRPMDHWFPWLLPHLDTLHVKDALESEHKVVPAGEGDGQIHECLAWLTGQGWEGPLTLEPHLKAAGKMGGFSGPELFAEAARALRKITLEIGIPV